MTHFLPPDGGELKPDDGQRDHEHYVRLLAALFKLPGVQVRGNGYTGENFVPLQEVVRILAEEFLVEEIDG